MLRGYRWIKTGRDVWQLEGLPRQFHGAVSPNAAGTWTWHTGYGGREQGESATRREAMDCVETARYKEAAP